MNEILQRLQNLPEDRRAKIVELFNRYDPTTPGVIEYVSGRDIHDRASSANPSPVRVVRATKYEAAMQRIAALEDELNRVKTMLAATPEAGPSIDRAELPLPLDRADLAASIASAGKVAPDAFASWPRNVLEQLAADLYSFIRDLGPHPRERLEQHVMYRAALGAIAEQGSASKHARLARDTLNGKQEASCCTSTTTTPKPWP